MNIPHACKRRLISVYLSVVAITFYSPIVLEAASAKASQNRSLPSKSTKSVYKAPVRSSRISATLIGDYIGPGLGLQYEYILASFLHLTSFLAYTQASLKGKVSVNVEETITSETMRAGLGFRFLLKKRFYLGGSIHGSLVKGKYGYAETTGDGVSFDIPFSTELAHADLYIGNEWLLKHQIHIGVDWVGIGIPITMKVKDEASEAESQALEFLIQDSISDRVTGELTEQVKLFYLAVHIGYRF